MENEEMNEDTSRLSTSSSLIIEQGEDEAAVEQVEQLVEVIVSRTTQRFDLIQAMNSLAQVIEFHEDRYQSQPGVSYFTNHRDEYPIGSIISVLENHEHFFDTVVAKMTERRGRDIQMSSAACRLLLASSPSHNQQHSPLLAVLSGEQEKIMEYWVKWICDAELPLRTYATGLLGDRQVADAIVKEPVPVVLLERLKSQEFLGGYEKEKRRAQAFAMELTRQRQALTNRRSGNCKIPVARIQAGTKRKFQERSDSIEKGKATELENTLQPSAQQDSLMEMDVELLKKKELIYILQCISQMGEYQEILAPVFQFDCLDMVMILLHFNDVEVLFHAVHLASHLLAHKKFALSFVDAGGVRILLRFNAHPQASLFHGGVVLCLFGLASLTGVMERVLCLDQPVPRDLILYAISLLSSSQDHTRKHAVIFFGLALAFRMVLDIFDSNNGVYWILNLMRPGRQPRNNMEKQIAHHACLCLRQYFRMHVAIVACLMRRGLQQHSSTRTRYREEVSSATHMTSSSSLSNGSSSTHSTLPTSSIRKLSSTKALDLDDNAIVANLAVLERCRYTSLFPVYTKWTPSKELIHHRGILILLQLINQLHTVTEYRMGVVEMAQFALETLQIVALLPSAYSEICGTVLEDDRCGIAIILDAASSSMHRDPDIIRAALHVLCNCVCPHHKVVCRQHPYKDIGHFTLTAGIASSDRRLVGCSCSGDDKEQRQVRKQARAQNGIKVCLQLLRYKKSAQAADEIRLLACRALLGLARDRHILQILEKMQIGQSLAELVRTEPILEENAGLHLRFKEAALDLIALVTHRAPSAILNEATDPTVRKIEKATIVSRTNITYDPTELLQLIHSHLVFKGLNQTADMLMEEAKLQSLNFSTKLSRSSMTPTLSLHQSPTSTTENTAPPYMSKSVTSQIKGLKPMKGKSIPFGQPSPKVVAQSINSPQRSSAPLRWDIKTPESSNLSSSSIFVGHTRHSMRYAIAAPHMFSTDTLEKENTSVTSPNSKSRSRSLSFNNSMPSSPVLRDTHTSSTPSVHKRFASSKVLTSQDQPQQTKLDSIVSQYLREQHRQCSQPVEIVPPFSLVSAHVCPDRVSQAAANNVARRLLDRQILPPHGGASGAQKTRRLVHSRYRPWRTYRDDSDVIMTVASFLAGGDRLIAGTSTGELRMFNVWTTEVVGAWECHSSSIANICPALNSKLLLTSTYSGNLSHMSETKLWNLDRMSQPVQVQENLKNAVFSHSADRYIGLSADSFSSRIYSVETGNVVAKLEDERCSNKYKHTSACFSPSDDSVLSDGVLWDPRLPRIIYKFDRFSNVGMCYYHPSGNEILINSAVWDLRTFKLLRMVPALDECTIRFNSHGDVLYAFRQYQDDVELVKRRGRFSTSFKVLDAEDYKDITTVELEKTILDICIDKNDSYISVVEGHGNAVNLPVSSIDSACRLYEVGRRRPNVADSDVDDAHSDTDDMEEDWDDEEEDDGMDGDIYEQLSLHSGSSGGESGHSGFYDEFLDVSSLRNDSDDDDDEDRDIDDIDFS